MPQPSRKNLAAGLRPEAQLLLCCARTAPDSQRTDRLKALLGQPIDWCRLHRLALRHGMLPLLYRTLADHCPTAVPREILARFRAHFQANGLRNLFLTRELLRLLELLERRAIAAFAFKGSVLAAAVYGDLALRQFTDLDIFVHKQDVPRARDLLLTQGYTLPSQPHAADSQEAAYLESEYHYSFQHPDGIRYVELHWAFTPRHFCCPFDVEGLWERLETVSLAGTMVRTLAPEDLLPILCVHGAKHCWERLEWVCGIAELLRAAPTTAWDQVIDQARAVGQERLLHVGLVLARDLLGATLPAPFSQRSQADPAARLLAAEVCDRLFGEGPQAGLMQRHTFFLSTRERLRDRLPYLVHHLRRVNGRDRAWGPLPAFLSFLHRPMRLVMTHGNPASLLRQVLGI